MSGKKQTVIYLSVDNAAKLEALRKREQKTKSAVVNDLIEAAETRQHGTPAAPTAVGLYTGFLSTLEAYLFECVERDIIDTDTRHAAAAFYEQIVKELGRHAHAEAVMARMAVNN
jgi:hypothetical protein